MNGMTEATEATGMTRDTGISRVTGDWDDSDD